MPFKLTLPTVPSRYDGRPVVPIITTRFNDKVGAGAGLLVVAEEVVAAMPITGPDWTKAHKPGMGGLAAACGSCPTGAAARCYVQNNIRAGAQPAAILRDPEDVVQVTWSIGKGHIFRSAIAGDAAALPAETFEEVRFLTKRHGNPAWLGYTHDLTAEHLRGSHVKSCDSPEDTVAAKAAKWRTFESIAPKGPRVQGGEVHLAAGEFLCPASAPAIAVRGKMLSCARCLACSGTNRLSADAPTATVLRHSSGDFPAWAARGGTRVYNHLGRLVGRVAS